MSNSRNALMVGNTGYSITVGIYGKNENDPRVLIDLHDSTGTITETAIVKVVTEEGSSPSFSIIRTEADKTEPAESTPSSEPEPEPTPVPEPEPEEEPTPAGE